MLVLKSWKGFCELLKDLDFFKELYCSLPDYFNSSQELLYASPYSQIVQDSINVREKNKAYQLEV